MAMDYNPLLHEDTFEEDIEEEQYEEDPPFDENVLTLEQKLELALLEKENPTMTKSYLAVKIRMNLISQRAAFEDRELTCRELIVAVSLQEVIDWVPPCQLEGTHELNSDYDVNETCYMPSSEDVSSSLHTHMLLDQCYELICVSQKLATSRFENLTRDYDGICYDIYDLELRFLMHMDFHPLLEHSCLGDVLDIDNILNDLKTPKDEMTFRSANDVFYMIDGDEVDYFVLHSFKPEVDFIFTSNAFEPRENLVIEDKYMTHATSIVPFFARICVLLLWTTLYFFMYIVYCTNRRRTKGALAQPFDSND